MPTKCELLIEAKKRGLRGYSKLKKAELEKLLTGKSPESKPQPKPKPEPKKPKPKPKPKPEPKKPKPKPKKPKPEPKKPETKPEAGIKKSVEDLVQELKSKARDVPVNFICYESTAIFIFLEILNRNKNDCVFKLEGEKRPVSIISLADLRTFEVKKQIYDSTMKCKKPILGIMTFKAGHANMLIINKDLKTIEHYEPHGKATKPFDNVMKDLTQYFNSAGELGKYTYVPSTSTCPRVPPRLQVTINDGLQVFDGTQEQKKQRVGGVKDTGGFCCMWSFLHLEYRLKHPKEPENKLAQLFIDDFKDASESKLREMIRGYTFGLIEKLRKAYKTDANLKKLYDRLGRRSSGESAEKEMFALIKDAYNKL